MLYKSKANKIGIKSLAMLALRIIDTVMKSGIEAAKTSKKFLNLVEVNTRYQDATVPGDDKQVSDAIKSLFAQRKVIFDQIYSYLEGLLNSPDAEMKNAATRLFLIMDKYGKSFKQFKLADQSLCYIRIIEGLKNPEWSADLEKTLLTAKVAEFEQLQLDYEELYMGSGNNSSLKIAPSNLRKEMETAVKLHFDEVHWMADSIDTEPWHTLCRNIEQRFDEVNVSVSRQKPADASATDNAQTTKVSA